MKTILDATVKTIHDATVNSILNRGFLSSQFD